MEIDIYGTHTNVNFPVDICCDYGLNGVIQGNTCPKCGGKNINRVRRITGYLSTLTVLMTANSPKFKTARYIRRYN